MGMGLKLPLAIYRARNGISPKYEVLSIRYEHPGMPEYSTTRGYRQEV